MNAGTLSGSGAPDKVVDEMVMGFEADKVAFDSKDVPANHLLQR